VRRGTLLLEKQEESLHGDNREALCESDRAACRISSRVVRVKKDFVMRQSRSLHALWFIPPLGVCQILSSKRGLSFSFHSCVGVELPAFVQKKCVL